MARILRLVEAMEARKIEVGTRNAWTCHAIRQYRPLLNISLLQGAESATSATMRAQQSCLFPTPFPFNMKVLTHFCLLIGASNAFEFPFAIPFFSAKVPSVQVDSTPLNVTPRIAIIGAGAGGSSSAFWISKAKERFGLDVEVDVFEQSSYIGGRKCVPCLISSSCFPKSQVAPLSTPMTTQPYRTSSLVPLSL